MGTAERQVRLRTLLARMPDMTAAERERQRESFAYGNVKIDEPNVVRDAPPARKR